MSQANIPGTGTDHIAKGLAHKFHLFETLLGLFSTPIESGLRPHFGTQYFNFLMTTGSYMILLLLSVFHSAGIAYGSMGRTARSGLIGPGYLWGIYTIGFLIHRVRIYRRMQHPETERHSEWEEDGFGFWSKLPKGDDYWILRMYYEPGFVILLAGLLWLPHILQTETALYLVLAAVCLHVKMRMSWFRTWTLIRGILDAMFMGPIMADIASGKATATQLEAAHMPGFPEILARVPEKARAAFVKKTTGYDLPPELAATVSPVEVSEEKHAKRMQQMDDAIRGFKKAAQQSGD